MQPYETVEEVSARLSGTVCVHKGSPVFVKDVQRDEDGRITVRFHTLPYSPKTRSQRVLFSEFAVDSSAQLFNLGFFNYEQGESNRVCFFERLPARRYKQGLCSDTSRAMVLSSDGRVNIGPSFGTLISSEGFRDMFLNQYTPIDEAAALLEEADIGSAYAVHKDVALIKDDMERLLLMYKTQKAAFCEDYRKLTFKLPKSRKYLTELFSDIGIKAA